MISNYKIFNKMHRFERGMFEMRIFVDCETVQVMKPSVACIEEPLSKVKPRLQDLDFIDPPSLKKK